jgi:hypothetical protein
VDACELDFSFSLLETDFEGGLPQGWTADSLWHVSDQCVQPGAPDPTRWAYFGLDGSCHFNTGGAVAGAMVAPSFNIPANAVSASLSYASIYDGDRGSAAIPQGFDRAWVQVNGQVVDDVGPTPALGVWEDRQIDLSPFIGQTVAISWNFNSIDAISNSRLGWQVDAISLVAVTNNDCNTNGVPDDCEDCNGNSFADECDLLAGTSADCDSNGVPDDCDVLDSDCNSNGIPDACEPDSDDDGTPDGCDPDLDGDGVPNQIDVCQSSPANQAVNPLGGPMGDIDDDCAVTLIDYYYFDICLFLSGPGGDPVFQDCRDVFDFDGDGDVDLCDFAGLQQSILAEG